MSKLRVEFAGLTQSQLKRRIWKTWHKRCWDSIFPGYEHAFLITFKLALIEQYGDEGKELADLFESCKV
jgi:hypothetical protein